MNHDCIEKNGKKIFVIFLRIESEKRGHNAVHLQMKISIQWKQQQVDHTKQISQTQTHGWHLTANKNN